MYVCDSVGICQCWPEESMRTTEVGFTGGSVAQYGWWEAKQGSLEEDPPTKPSCQFH